MTEQLRVLKGFDEEALKDLCNRSTDGKCEHDQHKGSPEVKPHCVLSASRVLEAATLEMLGSCSSLSCAS